MKKKHFIILGFLTFWCGLNTLSAQVTIGENQSPQDFSVLELISTDGGLRLPQLTTVQRNSIVTAGNALANGLVIYNTTANCTEYWNGTRWVSLCTGTADITFGGGNPTEPSFPAAGDERGPFVPHDNPDCTEQDPAFTFTVMSGSDYLYVTVLNETTGEFRVAMDENLTVLTRTAILRITNNCTGEYKEFLFTQAGATGLCNPAADAPVIAAQNGESLCGKGAVYLYLSQPAATDGTGYVWSRNGKEIARDVANYIATQPGIYKVYAGAIGCETPLSASITVTAGTSGAPDPVTVIVGQNNGLVCDPTAETTIYATASSSGTIVWYKNGVRQGNKTGPSISAGLGRWFAVVEDGSCSSLPSNEILVDIDPDGNAQIPIPVFHINGLAVGSTVDVCSNGTLLLDVTNPQQDVTYTWYVDNDVKGSGTHYELAMAGLNGGFILQCRATGVMKCSSAGVSQISVSLGDAPARPPLSSNNTGNVLCGYSATLTTSSTADKYRWYKDNVLLAETTHPNDVYNASELGTYTLQVVDQGCVSEMSLPLVISQNSAYGAVSISPQITSLNQGNMRLFTAEINPEDATSTYSWTITDATPPTATGKSVLVTFGTVTTAATISVTATNACTPGGVTTATSVNVLSLCDPVVINPNGYTPASKTGTIIQSGSVPLTITLNGNPNDYNYQWYNGGSAINGATLRTYSAIAGGTYTCKATSKCDPILNATSDAFTITFVSIPPTSGGGTLSGRTAFDIASAVNSNSTCGNIAGRGDSVNFVETVTNTQNYVFAQPGGTVNNKRYAIVDNEGVLQPAQSLYGNLPVNNTLTLSFKTNLNKADASPPIVGRTYENAALVKVYIIYNNGSQDVAVLKTIRIQDCGRCRAKISSTAYKTFMCYNLGAEPQLDPFVLTAGHRGGYFEYGSPRIVKAEELANTGGSGKAWGIASGNASTTPAGSTVKGANDPCPAGWRVPNYNELEAVIGNNTITRVTENGRNGAKIGDALMIGYFGFYSNSKNVSMDNQQGWWWTSRANNDTKAYDFKATNDSGNGVAANVNNVSNRYSGDNVRCISE